MTLDNLLRDLRYLERAAATAPDLAGTVAVRREILRWGSCVVNSGLSGTLLTRTISELNDQLVRRVLELTAASHRLPTVPWCWLALGSEGRFEQTFVTDQDNGLIFSATDEQEADALRSLFLSFARAANENLDRCGFSLCQGEIMACNAKWCLSLDEWQQTFAQWVFRPDQMALLNATIFFDFRSLYGDGSLATSLRRYLLSITRGATAFQRFMSANALAAEPPLNFWGQPSGDGGVDLKKFGVRLFVDVARVFALASGVEVVDTVDRLRLSGAEAGLSASEIEASLQAFSELQRLRLQMQGNALRKGGEGEVIGNEIQPEALNEFDRALLREAIHQAKRLQQRLKLNYAL